MAFPSTEIIQPTFGENYKPGYVGFTFNDTSFISHGIVFFTKKPTHDVKVSHCFIVEDATYGLEASLNGVERFPLDKYFNDNNCHVVFKKPSRLSQEKDTPLILTWARNYLGTTYDYSLFLGYILRWILKPLENSKWLRKKQSVFNTERFICSEYASGALSAIPRFRKKTPLSTHHISKIDPLILIHGDVFSQWKFTK